MSREVSQALVLWGVDYSETSRIFTLLTPGRGRISVIAKGVRRKNSGLASLLASLNHIELVYLWKEGRQVQTLTDCSLLHGFEALKADLERGSYAAFPLEVAAKVAGENDPSEALFSTVLQGLHALEAWRGVAPLHAIWQVWQVLRVAGFAPSLDVCAHCGGPLGHGCGFRYDSGAACVECAADRRLAPETLGALRLLLAEDACPVDIDYNQELFQLTRHYAARQVESDFRSVRVLNELFPQ